MYPPPHLRNTTSTSRVPGAPRPDPIHFPSVLSSNCSPGFWVYHSLAFLCNFITLVPLNDTLLGFPRFWTSYRWKHPLCSLWRHVFFMQHCIRDSFLQAAAFHSFSRHVEFRCMDIWQATMDGHFCGFQHVANTDIAVGQHAWLHTLGQRCRCIQVCARRWDGGHQGLSMFIFIRW